VAW
jgi:hypothetical protein